MYSNLKKIFFISLILLFFVYPSKTFAQVVINELSTGGSSDWVEIGLVATESADLSSYKLVDKSGNEKELSGNLTPSNYMSFDWSNRLDNTGDVVKLVSKANGNQIDSISYGNEGGVCSPNNNESIGRVDNGNVIERFSSPTRDATNQGATLNPCPTPSPEPTATATSTPTTTPTASPTKTPTVKPTIAPTKTPTLRPSATPTEEPEETATPEPTQESESLVNATETPTPQGIVAGASTSKKGISPIANIFIYSGAGLMGIGGIGLYIKHKKQYNSVQ